jgi:predicted component of type VI protein secretion system
MARSSAIKKIAEQVAPGAVTAERLSRLPAESRHQHEVIRWLHDAGRVTTLVQATLPSRRVPGTFHEVAQLPKEHLENGTISVRSVAGQPSYGIQA